MITKPDTHTRPLPSHTTEPPRRPQLSRMVGRIVTAEAVYSSVAFRLEDGRWLYHCTQVHVYPSATVDHCWIDALPANIRRRLYEGVRFSFRAEVVCYERTDGSSDYGLKFIQWVKG